MNVPGAPLQQVSVQPLSGGYQSTPAASSAPLLDAVGQAAQQFGKVAAEKAAILQARQKQSRIFNKSASARAEADRAFVEFQGMTGQAAIDAGPKLVESFRSWAQTQAGDLNDDEATIFLQHAEDLALGLSHDIDSRSLILSDKMHDESAANVTRQNTQSVFGLAAAGGIGLREAPRTEGVTSGPPSTRPAFFLDERAMQERWNAIESAWREWSKAKPGSEYLLPGLLEKARADFLASAIEGSLTAGPHQDDRVAQALFDAHPGELGEHRDSLQAMTTSATLTGTADRAERQLFETQAGNEAPTSERLAAMLERVDSLTPPKEAADPDKWRESIRSGLRAREAKFQHDQAQARDDTYDGLDARMKAGEFKSFAQIAESPDYLKLAKEPQLQRALATGWKLQQRGEYVVTSDADYADAVDMLQNPDRRDEMAEYNFLAHPEKYSREDAETWDKAQAERLKHDAEVASKSAYDFRDLQGLVNKRAKEFYPDGGGWFGASKEAVLEQRGALLKEAAAWDRAYKRSHDGKEAPPEWMDKMLDEVHAQRVLGASMRTYPIGAPDPQIPMPPWEWKTGQQYRPQTMSGRPFDIEEERGSLLENAPPELVEQAIDILLSSGVDDFDGERIKNIIAELQLRREAGRGR